MVYQAISHSILDNQASLPFILPALILVGTLLAVLAADLVVPYPYKPYGLRIVAIGGVCLALYATIQLGSQPTVQAGLPLFNQLLRLDPWAIFFHTLLLGLVLGLLLLPTQEHEHRASPDTTAIYVAMLLGALLGTYFLVMAQHGVLLYLSLILITLSSAILLYNSLRPQAAEASLRYVLYSAISTALMLGGIAYWYGATGTLSLAEPGSWHTLQALPRPALAIILLLVLSGILMKLGAFPFHFWVAAVYQEAPMAVAAYLATLPKLAAVAAMARLYNHLIIQLADTSNLLQDLLVLIAILTMAIGHVAALVQTHPKRMLAYGSIAQGGLLLAALGASTDGHAILAYYSMVYGMMGLAAWVGLQALEFLTGSEHIHTYAGLGRQYPVLGIGLAIAMLSLVGLPPTAGFTGKLMLLNVLWKAIPTTKSPLLAVSFLLALLGSVISLYYYLKLPYTLFFKPKQQQVLAPTIPGIERLILILLASLLLAMFFSASLWVNALQPWGITL